MSYEFYFYVSHEIGTLKFIIFKKLYGQAKLLAFVVLVYVSTLHGFVSLWQLGGNDLWNIIFDYYSNSNSLTII